MAGLYLHIPFCKQACHYCDFHFSTQHGYIDRMVNALCAEIELRVNELEIPILQTVYFGGGTPSVLSERHLDQIFNTIVRHFQLKEDAEITLEANPDDLSKDRVKTLVQSPVNRLSMGIQSFHESDLKLMNRAHNSREARQALDRVFDAGFTGITADLIFGMPGSTLATWKENLEKLLKWPLPHVSCYGLTVELRTALHHSVESGKIILPDEEVVRSQFYFTMDYLMDLGLEHYELSNYALPGRKARHNSAYWHGEPYLGIGPSAHSYDGRNRSMNVANNALYMKAIESGTPQVEIEKLSRAEQCNERIMTALRLQEGLQWQQVENAFPEYLNALGKSAQRLIEKGWLEHAEKGIRLSREGKIMADRVMMEMFVE